MQITVATVNMVARLWFTGDSDSCIPRGHFDVLCVDEAGLENGIMENNSLNSMKEEMFASESNKKISIASDVGSKKLEGRPLNHFMESNELQIIHDIDKENYLIFSRTLNEQIINEKTEGSKETNKMEFDREED